MALTKNQRLALTTAIVVAFIGALGAVGAAYVGRDKGDDKPDQKAQEKTQACRELAERLSDEAGLVGELKGHLQLRNGLAAPKDGQFKDAWEAAHNGQAALPGAFNGYLATGHTEPTGAEIVTVGNNGVEELGKTLDAIGDGTGDEEAFSSLEDWKAKLNKTSKMVSVTCAS